MTIVEPQRNPLSKDINLPIVIEPVNLHRALCSAPQSLETEAVKNSPLLVVPGNSLEQKATEIDHIDLQQQEYTRKTNRILFSNIVELEREGQRERTKSLVLHKKEVKISESIIESSKEVEKASVPAIDEPTTESETKSERFGEAAAEVNANDNGKELAPKISEALSGDG